MSTTSCQQRTATTSGEASLLEDFQEPCTLHPVTSGVRCIREHTLVGLAGVSCMKLGIACRSQAPQLCSCRKEGVSVLCAWQVRSFCAGNDPVADGGYSYRVCVQAARVRQGQSAARLGPRLPVH